MSAVVSSPRTPRVLQAYLAYDDKETILCGLALGGLVTGTLIATGVGVTWGAIAFWAAAVGSGVALILTFVVLVICNGVCRDISHLPVGPRALDAVESLRGVRGVNDTVAEAYRIARRELWHIAKAYDKLEPFVGYSSTQDVVQRSVRHLSNRAENVRKLCDATMAYAVRSICLPEANDHLVIYEHEVKAMVAALDEVEELEPPAPTRLSPADYEMKAGRSFLSRRP